MPKKTSIEIVLGWAREKGWNQSELARRLDVTPGAITNWKARGEIPPEFYRPIADLFGRSVDEIYGREVKASAWPNPGITEVPVSGEAWVDADGYWTKIEPSSKPGYLEMSSRDRAAYAIRIVGDAMHPRVRSGEYVVVNPGRTKELMPDDEVLVTLKDGRSFVRFLSARHDDRIILRDIHGRPLTLRESTIKSIHYVQGIEKEDLFRPNKNGGDSDAPKSNGPLSTKRVHNRSSRKSSLRHR